MRLRSIIFVIVSMILLSACGIDYTNNIVLLNADRLAESDFVKPEGGKFRLRFTVEDDWKAVISGNNLDWVSINSQSGTKGENILIMTSDVNHSTEKRSVLLSISSRGITEDLLLTQEGSGVNEGFLVKEASAAKAGEELEITFVTPYGIPKYNIEKDWVQFSDLRQTGENRYEFILEVSANEGFESRKCHFDATSVSGLKFSIEIIQDGSIFNVDEEEVQIPSEGGPFTIRIECNVPYKVELPEWIIRSGDREADEEDVEFLAKPNPLPEERESVIRFTSEGFDPVEVRIIQQAGI